MKFVDNRRRTRDLLLEYESNIVPLHPRAGGLSMVYPWETQNLTLFGDWLYKFASHSGYTGSKDDFYGQFGLYLENSKQEIVFSDFANFPQIGVTDKLYFDLDEKILYYWTGSEYLPANAMLIANTILDGGEA